MANDYAGLVAYHEGWKQGAQGKMNTRYPGAAEVGERAAYSREQYKRGYEDGAKAYVEMFERTRKVYIRSQP